MAEKEECNKFQIKTQNVKIKRKGYVLCYDIVTLPNGDTIKNIFDVVKGRGVCYYDGSKGSKPFVVHLGGEKNKGLLKVKFIDVKNKINKNGKTK